MNIFQEVRRSNEKDVIEKLQPAHLAECDEDNGSILHEAIAFKKEAIARWCIENGIDLDHQNAKGMSPLHTLPFHPNSSMAALLVSKNPNLSLTDKFGNTPLWYAVFNAKGNYEIVSEYMKLSPDINAKNNAGRSPLDFARQINDETLINILLNEKTTA